MSVLTRGELLSWTLRANCPPKYGRSLTHLFADVTIVDVDTEVADRFGKLRADLLDRGTPVAAFDLMIAATALIHDLTLVTHNTQHFLRVPGLSIDDWLPA